MKYNKAIIWREFNRDIKSWKTIMFYISVSLISLYFYWLNNNFADYIIALVNGLLLMSVYTSIYGMNNVAVTLSLPISIRDHCLGKTIYVLIKMILITFINFILIWAITYTGLIILEVHLASQCYVFALGTLSAISVFYCSLLLMLLIKRTLVTLLFIAVSGYISFSRNLILNDISIRRGFLVVAICLFLVLWVDVRLKRLNSERIINNWI